MTIGGWLRRVQYLFRRDRFTADLDEEMRLHVELRARKLEAHGVSAYDAPYAAQRQFGNRSIIQDISSELWGLGAWERLVQDLRLGFRALRKTPGFTAVAVLTLALGLGINTAVFSVVNAIMLRALPYPDSDRLISLWEEGSRPGQKHYSVAPANLADYRTQVPAIASFRYASESYGNRVARAHPG
jgi:macrolide transport system ATP-binding/permease protein